MAMDLWCEQCQRWTMPDFDDESQVVEPAVCGTCGEPYQCGECGFEISAKGECLRPPDLGVCPNSIISVTP